VKNLPNTDNIAVVRGDFSNDALWVQLQEEIVRPAVDDNQAAVTFVEDRTLIGLSEEAIVNSFPCLYPDEYEHPVVFVVDTTTVMSPEHHLLVMDLDDEEASAPFRCLPREVQAIENNLSLANMDFSEFAESADADGVYRGS
jgi:hypothetical protein